jgi:class 3 adenylate cyclase
MFPEYLARQAGSGRVKYAKAYNQFSEAQFSQAELSTQIVPLYKVQNALRPLYGKGEPHPPAIGDHPDFEFLRGTTLEEFCPVTTLFMDLEASTRLGILYPLSDVAKIKNAFICMAIEVVKSFDGHVHRIMGDAVMAYFGGRTGKPGAAAIDAINCAALLQLLVRVSVLPHLDKQGYGDSFGIRIGLDHGPRDNVLWRSYGYPGMEEITATSFFVDVASKLQHAAGRHQVMIGDSLKGFLDFPDELLSVKTVVERGEEVRQPYLLPNITDAEGRPINYRQHLLSWERYLQYSPLAPQVVPASGTPAVPVTATLHAEPDGVVEGKFVPTGTLGPKGKHICFVIGKLPYLPMLPYTVRCIVENHGAEARKASESSDNHETTYEVTSQAGHRDRKHWEHLQYRGLHYLTVEVRNNRGVVARTRFGVYVE